MELYSFKLSETDQKEIIAKLTQDNDPYRVEAGKIMVPPDSRQKMAAYLMEYGLPHRPLDIANADGGGMIPPSDKEKEAIALQKLQAKLIEQMRVLSFVADAYVEIVPSDEEAALMGNAHPATAQVLLQLKPGGNPSREQIDAIVSMVAYSVRGLDPNNVKVITDQGKILSKQAGTASTSGPSGSTVADTPTDDENLALKTAFEKEYKDKVTPSLDRIFGADRYTFNVDADIDYSQKKIVSKNFDGSIPTETQEKKEQFNNSPKDSPSPADKKGSKEVALPDGASVSTAAHGGNQTNYVKSDIRTKNAVNETDKEVVIPRGALRKLTASLAVDRALTDQQQAKWEKWLENTMGIDESRGDSVVVMAAAFANPIVVNDLADKMKNYHGPASDSPLSVSPTVMIGMTAGSVLVLLTLVAVFLMKQHKVQVDKSSLLLSTGNSTHTSEITDLLNEKSGKSTAQTATTLVNNRAELEKLAKEKPTRVAELLKSTWLSEKER